MKLTGDFSKLTDLVQKFAKVADRQTMVKINQAMGDETMKLVDEEFDKGRNPYGQQWKKPLHRSGPPMIDTTRLRTSFRLSVNVDGYKIRNSRGYSGYLQDGTYKMKPRKMLPDQGNLSNPWRNRIYGAAAKVLKKELGL